MQLDTPVAGAERSHKPYTIVLCGGGTGGHITPLLAVAHELKQRHPHCRLVYIGEHGGKFAHLITANGHIDESHFIFAGKFRRYHGESWWRRLTDVRTNLLNLRDMFRVIIGFCQSLVLLGRLKPNVIFIKGGFVGVPVGLAAALRRQSFITHDSDSLPGLANRIVGRWATYHATGMPAEFYPYDKTKIRFVGVPLGPYYQVVTDELQRQCRQELGLPEQGSLVVITGGSQGARDMNKIITHIVPDLLNHNKQLQIVHQVGKGAANLYRDLQHSRLHVHEYLTDLYRYTAAADVIITRGSATTLAELGAQEKATVIIPSPFLAGGHQLKNAAHLAERQAAVVLDENSLKQDPQALLEATQSLLDSPAERQQLGQRLQKLTKTNAAAEIAELLLKPKRS